MIFLRSGRMLFAAATVLLYSSSIAKPFHPPQHKIPDPGFYVVIAAYASTKEDYATRFRNKAASMGEQGVVYEFFPKKNMYFVYLEKFTDLRESIRDMRGTRKEGTYTDAWVYCYRPNEIAVFADADPVENLKAKEQIVAGTETKPAIEREVDVDAEAEPEVEIESEVEEKAGVVAETDNPEEPEVRLGNYKIFFHVHHGRDLIEVPASVQVIEPTRGQVVKVLMSNESHYIDAPSNLHSLAQFEAEVFGYRKLIHTIDLEQPVNDTTDYFVDLQADSMILDFDMVRYAKGDIFTMYNVYFFSHSSIMRPESRNELNQLLDMLIENPNYQIRIHGHTNGSTRIDDTRYRPSEDVNFFSLTGAETGSFTAARLSEMRAESVKTYLVNSGISSDRMELKGWGGKRPLYKKLDPQAIKNVRVEVEIVKE